ncbi:Uncharacterized protein OBRU01_10691 [Operophtera brumata]|uniref:Uncharacterized protein n=1 Tax=Operophtera brumata TaxID=104452 RepID=A0A0L7LDA9_OPEBR|nr:Uncharacterized protein OBRU01_10691 [Operophtera brumata]
MLRKIPPSCSNLFDAEKFTSTLAKMGEPRKVFWPHTKDRVPATQTGPNTTAQTGAMNSNRPFRGRGGTSRGRRQNDRPAASAHRGARDRRHSPSSHRDRRSYRKY